METKSTLLQNEYNIPISGKVCEGNLIYLEWPRPEHFDLITNLRNLPSTRKWFLNQNQFDPVKNREWLAKGMDRPREALLSIVWKNNDLFLGTIGWTNWDLTQAEAEFGRIALDMRAIRQIKPVMPSDYEGVAADMSLTVCNFAFTSMHLRYMCSYVFKDNLLAIKLNERAGMKKTGIVPFTRSNGETIEMIKMGMNFEEWKEFHKQQV